MTGLIAVAAFSTPSQAAVQCAREVTASVVTIDQPIVNSRLGASNVNGMMFALRRDVVPINPAVGNITTVLPDGRRNAKLRVDKRPRPLVLRVAAGDCLTVSFQNLLAPAANPFELQGVDGIPLVTVAVDEQVAERRTSFHASGMQLRSAGGIANDGSNVGRNQSSLVAPGGTATYRLWAEKEGVFQILSHGALVGSDANQGNTANGLFGQVIVEPAGARIYRNTVTEEEMRLATRRAGATLVTTPQGHPVLNYEAIYPLAPTRVWAAEGKAGLPILNMICNTPAANSGACQLNEIVHTEVDAVVAGPRADGTFPPTTYPLESINRRNPAYHNRLEPFRDFGQVWHDEVANAQAFPGFYDHNFGAVGENGVAPDPLTPVFAYLLKGVRDKFMINYAVGGIGTEILANRLGVGPMHDCLNCAYEEFFLTHFTVGEVGQLVDVPANFGLETLTPTRALQLVGNLVAGNPDPLTQFLGPKAAKALYPGDPANINHSYTGDFIKFRNTHNGFEQHVFHLHNHQWLFNPNDDNSNYIDAQGIGPGMGYTYEIANGGSGNRNKSSGDAIYHCHFYPHFAQGMWYIWRNHDVFEAGTRLAVTRGATINAEHIVPFALQDGTPAEGARALPDGEIMVGTPIPAIVPLPGKPLPPMPAAGITVKTVDRNGDGLPDSSQAVVDHAAVAGPDGIHGTADDVNPGFPFWIAGIACNPADTAFCENGIVGQRPSTPPMDMLTRTEAQALVDDVTGVEPFRSFTAEMKTNFVSLAGEYTQMHGGLPRHALHGYKAGGAAAPTPAGVISPVDLTKFLEKARPTFYPEGGTEIERSAMAVHSRRNTASSRVLINGTVQPASFVLNGLPPVPGAPYSDGCVDDAGNPVQTNGTNTWFGGGTRTQTLDLPSGPYGAYTPRIYRGANIQYDAVLNKAGYHYPQQRIVSLWEDALPVIEKSKPGEPLVMRLNTFDCAMYHHTNIVPETFELDDYQVRTPTDIIGQHIHLPKWDLTTTDGAANGWNYEDGTLAAGTVRERIHAINNWFDENAPGTPHLIAEQHPFFPAIGPGGVDWTGARVTLQRWFADPLLNRQGVDRGLGVIFTHDHYGPSSFQQIGLYSTVLIEPARSDWKHSETGNRLGCDAPGNYAAFAATGVGQAPRDQLPAGCRADGGPTSWQAAIETVDLDLDGRNDSFREFYFEYSDFQHAYEAGVYVGAGPFGQPSEHGALNALGVPEQLTFPAGTETFRFAIAPPHILPVNPIFPDLTVEAAGGLSAGCPARPCPTSIDFLEPGMFVVNYRNEPVGLRIYDPNAIGPDGRPGAQASGDRGDLGFAFQSRTDRAIPEMNVMPNVTTAPGYTLNANGDAVARLPGANLAPTLFPPHINIGGVGAGDPFTPMMRTYSGDRVRVKAQAGGDEEEHSVSIHGVKWLQGGSGHGRAPNSGWRNQQAGGISEQFTMAAPVFMDFSESRSGQQGGVADYLYMMDALQDGFWTGDWGLMRNYGELQPNLHPLPNNPTPTTGRNRNAFLAGDLAVCPRVGPDGSPTPVVNFDVTAVLANTVLPAVPGVTITPTGQQVLRAATPDLLAVPNVDISTLHAGGPLTGVGTLVYNSRGTPVTGFTQGITVNESGPLHDPTAMMYVLTSDLVDPGNPALGLNPGTPVEPLVLRVNAGDCVTVTLRNALPAVAPDLPNYNDLRHAVKRDRNNPEGVTTFSNNLIRPSSQVGMHLQLLEYDVTRSDGTNVGNNPVQTVAPGGSQRTYTFYAGSLDLLDNLTSGIWVVRATPVEFGGANILPADRVKQPQKGLFGQIIVEPRGANWTTDATTRTAATVNATVDGSPQTYRDFALVWQKMMNYRYASSNAVQNESEEGPGLPENPPHTLLNAANYRAEPTSFRFGIPPLSAAGGAHCSGPITAPKAANAAEATCFGSVLNAGDLFSNVLTGGADPQTPIFTVGAGSPFRVHLTNPNSSNRGTTFQMHGHVWPRDPYVAALVDPRGFPTTASVVNVGSVRIGHNPMSFYLGAQESVIGSSHFSFVLPSAGGADAVPGDYLMRDTAGAGMGGGAWGIVRVE